MDRVAKRYKVRRTADAKAGRRSLRQKLTGFARRQDEFWAVRDVSFAVAEGETLGIIGHNGAGKSTILKLLSSVTTPTSGEIRIYGRLSALIEVGSGFHPELTGRENIYLSGSILGMRRGEIADKLERIIEFAGVRDFIDEPVNTTPPACTCGSASRLLPISSRTFSCSTKSWLSVTPRFNPSASIGSRNCTGRGGRSCSSPTTWAPSSGCAIGSSCSGRGRLWLPVPPRK